MAVNSVHTISAGKPKATGGILHAPVGTALPTDITTAPNASFIKLGKVGEDGVQPGGERSMEEKKDWAGDVIANLQSGHSVSFSFTLLSVFDPAVLKVAFGDSNVTVTAATATSGTKITVAETGSELPYGAWIFEMIGTASKTQRIVVPNAQVGTVEESPYVSGDLQGFSVTLNCYPDESGVKVYRYYDDGKFSTT
ncbi:hypothetical protein [Prescottella agglutinans]|uniref:Phage tail protein n=1 Tax=Prescottella agglutinans TaxID=1644129 RepID=A0ABT6M4V5_9NOCA|nr:hypothetical protein [Prescottella agglutinans]MDH6279341.1 hypothetical protein [Prescottella agglutinans]